MGRKVVVELKCDRCRKVEHVATQPGEENLKDVSAFSCSFMGKTVMYSDLCTGCKEVIATHVADITRDMKKVTPRRTNATRAQAMAKVAGAPTPPPVTAAPTKPSPGLGERKADSHGPSQRP